MKEISIPYGADKCTSFRVEEKNLLEVVKPQQVAPASDVKKVICDALENPVGCKPLEELVTPESRVVIISDDISRPTPVREILEVLLPKLHKAGIPREQIKIVMALGSHRYMTEAEMRTKVGDEIFESYQVVNSEFRDPDGLIDLGHADDGSVIQVSWVVMDGDFRIGIGNIVPHPAMGWSGGGKILYPGVTSEQTVMQFHLLQGLANENLFGMDECPIRLGVEKWVDVIGLDFIINTILDPSLQLYKAVAGHYVQAHRQGVNYAKEVFGCPIAARADVAVVSSYPVDLDLWQASKGYLCGERATVEGGTIILVTPCYEGIGPHKEYGACIGDDNAEKRLLDLQAGKPVEGDPLALAIGTCVSKIRKRRKLVIVTGGMSRESCEEAGLRYYPADGLQEAVNDVLAENPQARITVITHGGETVAYEP